MYNQLNTGSIRNNYDKNRFRNNKLLTEYIMKHLYGKSPEVDYQINVFKAYWLIMAIFHEVKSNRPMIMSAKHIKTEIKKYKALQDISFSKLPNAAKLYLIFLKLHLYSMVLIVTKVINLIRENKK